MARPAETTLPQGTIDPTLEHVQGPLPRSLNDLLEPDIILPDQFFEGPRRDSYLSGEQALMLAVLEDGIRCFQESLRNPRLKPRLLARQAEQWILSDDWDWPFSFNNVCDHLGLEPRAVRSTLLRQKLRGDATARSRTSHVTVAATDGGDGASETAP